MWEVTTTNADQVLLVAVVDVEVVEVEEPFKYRRAGCPQGHYGRKWVHSLHLCDVYHLVDVTGTHTSHSLPQWKTSLEVLNGAGRCIVERFEIGSYTPWDMSVNNGAARLSTMGPQ
jgi:hypothetical protein